MEKYNPEEEENESKEKSKKKSTEKSTEKLLEKLDVDPDEFLDTVKRYMELYSRIVLLQFPLTDDLKEAMKELFEKQYPRIKPYNQIWHVNWVFEGMEGVANSLSIDLVNFFEKVEKDENYKEGYDDYDKFVELYTKPYEAHRFVIDYGQIKLNDEELRIYEQVVEEEYQEDLIGFIELNQMRNDFLNLVYVLALKYFDISVDDLSPDQLIHYNIIAGMGYEDYFDVCKELNYYLVEEKMQDFPGLGYYEFMVKQCEKLQDITT